MRRIAIPAVFLLLLPLLLAAHSYEIPALGIRVQLDNGFSPSPLKPPRSMIRLKDNAKVVNGKNFWLYRQTGGFWRGENGRTITLREPRFAPYAGPETGTEEDCEKTFQPFAESEKMLGAWLKCAGFPEVRFSRTQRTSSLEVYEGKSASAPTIFLVRSLQQKRFFLLFYEVPEPPSEEELSALRKGLSETVFLLNRKNTTGNDRISRAVSETLHMPGWWKSQSAHYLFLSNVTDRSRIRRIQQDLERARVLFSQYLPLPRVTEPGVVKIFGKRDEYLAYAGKEMAWSAGFWDPARRELVISPLNGKAGKAVQEKFMRTVLFHEGFHQYLFHGLKARNIPLWFNEGCAQFFEESIVRGGKRVISLSDGRLRLTRSAVQQAGNIQLMQFFRQSHQEFYKDSLRDFNYGYAYAVMYYLLQGAPEEKKEAYAAIPGKYLEAFRTANSPEEALNRAFAGINTAELKADIQKFWDSPKRDKTSSKHGKRRRK